MSDRPCNFCCFCNVKRRAKERKETAFIKYQQGWAVVWFRKADGTEYKSGIEYMELPDHCCC